MGQDLTRLDLLRQCPDPGPARIPAGLLRLAGKSGVPLALNGAGVGECLAKVFGHMSRLEPAAHTGRAGPLHMARGQKSEGEAGLAGSRSGRGR